MSRRSLVCFEVTSLGRSFVMSAMTQGDKTDDPILDQLVSGTFDELNSLAYWIFSASVAQPQEIFLDVGAFSGIYALSAVTHNPSIKCVAFEPSAIAFGRLAQNVKLNGHDLAVIPANLALSASARSVTFPHRYGIYNLCPGESLGGVDVDHTQTATAVKGDVLLDAAEALPDYLNSKAIPVRPFRRISTIKVDVERHEPEVLRGLARVLTEHRPAVLCEVLDADAALAIDKVIKKSGYVRTDLLGEERNALLLPSEQVERRTSVFRAWRAKHLVDLVVAEWSP